MAFSVSRCEGKQLDQIGMVQSFHGFDLVEKLFQDFPTLFHIVSLQLLGCHLQIASELGLVHIPKLTRPNLCTKFKLADSYSQAILILVVEFKGGIGMRVWNETDGSQ